MTSTYTTDRTNIIRTTEYGAYRSWPNGRGTYNIMYHPAGKNGMHATIHARILKRRTPDGKLRWYVWRWPREPREDKPNAGPFYRLAQAEQEAAR